jgi:glycosyltransferase involved in cell wall biosynthesis
MASSCPVIASNVWGTNEMIRDGTDGLVVPPDSVGDLTEAIATILADPSLAREMGENARTHAEQQFDWKKIGKQFADIYQRVS